MTDVSAVILAGGRGSRFGREKASAPFRGRPMVEWVVEAARDVAGEVVVCVAQGRGLGSTSGVALVEDEAAFEGPVRGLISGMRRAEGEWVLALACDTPLVQPAVLRLLLGHRRDGAEAVVPVVGGFVQWLVAVYRREDALLAFEAAWAAGERSLRGATAALGVLRVGEDELTDADSELVSFRAANTMSELRELEAVAGRLRGREDAPRFGGGNARG